MNLHIFEGIIGKFNQISVKIPQFDVKVHNFLTVLNLSTQSTPTFLPHIFNHPLHVHSSFIQFFFITFISFNSISIATQQQQQKKSFSRVI